MEKLQEVLILEDDVDFEPNFHDDLEQVLEEAHSLAPQLVGSHVSQMQASDALIGEWMWHAKLACWGIPRGIAKLEYFYDDSTKLFVWPHPQALTH